MTDQEPDRGKRKRPYRQRVICGECKKELDSDYKDNHAKTVHKGKKVAFAMVRERNQRQLAFFTKSSTESQLSHKLSRSDIQNDVHYQEDIRNESTGTDFDNQAMGHCVIFSGKQGAAPPSRIVPVRLCLLEI